MRVIFSFQWGAGLRNPSLAPVEPSAIAPPSTAILMLISRLCLLEIYTFVIVFRYLIYDVGIPWDAAVVDVIPRLAVFVTLDVRVVAGKKTLGFA